ncbi:DMT family transporter [Clostridium sp. AM58-1XD]|uniref:DMT family transporter n=1 Tax=Clostridium sp. AM58-1XD TaxID=2292307 RepID=UPI001FA90876|nr:DMT family transporter [Clostridium sp. AM58-1XD]
MEKKKGYVYLLFTFVIWGSLYVVGKYAMASIPPVTLLMFRYLISSVLLSVILFAGKKHRRLEKGDIRYFIAIGGLGYFVSIAFQLIGTNLIDASLASLINAMNPVSITIMATVFSTRK